MAGGAVSEVRAKFSAVIGGFRKQVQDARASLSGISDESQQVSADAKRDFDKLDDAIDDLGDGASLDDLVGELDEAEAGAEGFGDAMQESGDQSEASMSNLKGTIVKVSGAIVALGAVAGAGLVGAIKVTDDYNKALNGVQASTGATDEEIKGMGESLKNIYANNYGEDFNDIGESLAYVAQTTGLSGKALETTTQNALMLRDTFQMDVEGSIQATDQLMKQFGITSDEAMTLLAQGAQKGLNKQGDLTDVISEYAVGFKNLGMDSEQMFNVLQAGSENGAYSVDKIGDAIKEMGIRVKDESKSTMEAFGDLGFNAEELTGQFAKGGEAGQEAFQKVMKKLSEIEDPVERNRIGVALFGSMFEDLEAGAVTALGNIDGSADKSADTLKKIDQVKYNSIGEAMQGIKRSLEVEVIDPINTRIMPTINEFITKVRENLPTIKDAFSTAFTAIMDTVNKFKPTFESLFTIFKNVGGWLGSTLVVAFSALSTILPPIVNTITSIVAKFTEWKGFVPILTGIVSAMLAYKTYMLALKAPLMAITAYTKAYTMVQTALNLAMSLNPIGIIIALLVGLGVALYMAWTKSETFRNIVLTAWDAIKTGVAFVIDWLKVVVPQAIAKIIQAWQTFKTTVSNLWTGIKAFAVAVFTAFKTAIINIFVKVVTGIISHITALKTGLINLFNLIKSTVVNIVNKQKEALITAFNAIKSGITRIVSAIKNFILTYFGAIKTFLSGWISVLKTIFSTGFNAVKAIISSVLKLIKAIFRGDFGAIKGIVSDLLSRLKSIFSDGLSNVMSIVKDTASDILSAFSDLDLFSVGKDIVRGLWDGITNMSGWIGEKVTGFASGIKTKVEGFFKIKSPSRVFREIGGYLGKGLAIGIEKSRKLVHKTTQGLAESAMIDPDTVGVGSISDDALDFDVKGGGGSGGSGGAGTTTNYQAPLMNIENYYQNDETDAREISTGLYNLQIDHDRAKGKKIR